MLIIGMYIYNLGVRFDAQIEVAIFSLRECTPKIYYLRMSFRKHLLRRALSSFNSFTRYSADGRRENDIYFQVKTNSELLEIIKTMP